MLPWARAVFRGKDRGIELENDWKEMGCSMQSLLPHEEKGEITSIILSRMMIEDGRRLLEQVLPDDLAQFQLTPALNSRLRQLLDRQEKGVPLKDAERHEAEGSAEPAEPLTLLRLRAEGAALTAVKTKRS